MRIYIGLGHCYGMRSAMKVTDVMHLERTKCAIEGLLKVMAHNEEVRLVHRLAVARRFSLSYYAFMSYLIERLNLSQEASESLTMEEIIIRCRSLQLFTPVQEQYVMKMGMIYAVLTCYDTEFYPVSEELLQEMPQLATFLYQYCALQSSVAITPTKHVRSTYEYSI